MCRFQMCQCSDDGGNSAATINPDPLVSKKPDLDVNKKSKAIITLLFLLILIVLNLKTIFRLLLVLHRPCHPGRPASYRRCLRRSF